MPLLPQILRRLRAPIETGKSFWWRERIQHLWGELRLELNDKRELLRPVTNDDFLGYIVRKDYLLVRKRVLNNLKVKLREYQARLVTEGEISRRYRYDVHLLDRRSAGPGRTQCR